VQVLVCLLNPVLQTLDSGALLPGTHCSERHGYSITLSAPAIRLTAEKQNKYQGQQKRKAHKRGNLVCR
jgi:hypothetical protein